MTITGIDNYFGTRTETFKIKKAGQAITVKSTASSINVGKTATVSITGAKGTKSYKSSNTTIATVNATTGVVTGKKPGTVTITAETEGRESDSGSAASHIYRFATDESALVLTLRLWFRPSLDADGWTEIGSTEVTLEKTSGAYTHSLPEGVDLSSGFFKVSLEK